MGPGATQSAPGRVLALARRAHPYSAITLLGNRTLDGIAEVIGQCGIRLAPPFRALLCEYPAGGC